MRKFSELPADGGTGRGGAPARSRWSGEEAAQAISAIAMRCGGCGAKVGATVLARALGALRPLERDDVLIGLHAPTTPRWCACRRARPMVHTVDFFRAFIDDPYVFGKVAANHALGDIFAMGAEAQSATSIVTVPPGLESKIEDVLFQMMSGAVEVLNEADCALVGGHTGEGARAGARVRGQRPGRRPARRDPAQGRHAARATCCSSPSRIGTGTLFAAHMRMQARGRWIDAALDIDVPVEPPGRARAARAWRHCLHRSHRLRPARASGGDDPAFAAWTSNSISPRCRCWRAPRKPPPRAS